MNPLHLSRTVASAAAAVLVGALALVPAAGSAHADSTTPIDTPGFVGISEYTATEFRGDLYFGANDGVHGYELWRTDGTTSGTERITDLDDRERYFDVLATPDRLFVLTARGAVLGYDGEGAPVEITGFGQRPLGDMSGADGVLGDRLLLTGSRFELFAVDPGSNVARPISPGFSAFEFGSSFAVLDDHAYFSGRYFGEDGLYDGAGTIGVELLRTDGVTTEVVADIDPGSESSFPEGLVTAGDQVFFSASGDARGHELWVTDGSAAGTHLVRDHNGDEATYFSGPFVPHGDEIYYLPGVGDELWRTDGSAGGTQLVLDLSARRDDLRVLWPTLVGSEIYFLLGSHESSFLTRTDGTRRGTQVIAQLPGSVYDTRPLTTVGDDLYFVASSAFGRVLWRSDGTAAGTIPVSTGGFGESAPTIDPAVRELGVLDGRVIVTAAVDEPSPVSYPLRRLYAVDPAAADPVRRAVKKPRVTGETRPRGTLTVSTGDWTPSPNTFTYQWFRNGDALVEETTPSLSLKRIFGTRVGDTVYAVVTASGIGSGPVGARSETVRVTRSGLQPIPVAGSLRVRGNPLVGSRLRAVPARTPAGTRLDYRWVVGGRVLPDAHRRTLLLKRPMVGKRVRVRVTMRHIGSDPVRQKSRATGPVRR